jgi:hypothetical protein
MQRIGQVVSLSRLGVWRANWLTWGKVQKEIPMFYFFLHSLYLSGNYVQQFKMKNFEWCVYIISYGDI